MGYPSSAKAEKLSVEASSEHANKMPSRPASMKAPSRASSFASTRSRFRNSRDYESATATPQDGPSDYPASSSLNPDPPPEYAFRDPALESLGIVPRDDGRADLDISANSRTSALLNLFSPQLQQQRREDAQRQVGQVKTASRPPPRLNIVVQIVGSRGDVQPFIALGTQLQAEGHRVRIATHDCFENFVKESGLEFYPIGGDPSSLMAYMVKNPGIIPKFESIKSGEIAKKRKMIYEMLDGCWNSCIQPDPDTKVPFIADAIIANPPSFAHVHCAQALSIPCHLMFTMPWSATTAYPHPLANICRTDTLPHNTNMLSYRLIELLTWQGLSGVINAWRKMTLSLEPVPITMGAVLLEYLQVPFTYCWSPAFVPRASDWPSYIDVCGFFFRKDPIYTPPEDLDDFLKKGPPPIYIGFGSIVMEDAAKMTRTLLGAVRACGVRAIISRGWSNLGAEEAQDPDVFFLGDCPHEWLFKQVSCVIHHGGAGTTACGLLNGTPTAIVPFFGDQQFWGQMIAAANAGPLPIHNKNLNETNLAEAIRACLTEQAHKAASDIAQKMKMETGVQAAVESFNKNLPVDKMVCDLLPGEVAIWSYKQSKLDLKLSDKAAFILVERRKINAKHLKLYQTKPVYIDNLRWDPVTAGSAVLLDTTSEVASGLSQLVMGPVEAYNGNAFGAKRQGNASANAAKSVGLGFGRMMGALPKATLVDMPLGLSEGLRRMPALVGDDVRDNGRVTDWKSGGVVAGKTFVNGFYDGLSGLVVKPYQGAMQDGLRGFSKGVAQATVGLVANPGAAMFGLMAYPFLGMYKSMASAMLSDCQKQVLLARQVYGSYMAEQSGYSAKTGELGLGNSVVTHVIDLFEALHDPKTLEKRRKQEGKLKKVEDEQERKKKKVEDEQERKKKKIEDKDREKAKKIEEKRAKKEGKIVRTEDDKKENKIEED